MALGFSSSSSSSDPALTLARSLVKSSPDSLSCRELVGCNELSQGKLKIYLLSFFLLWCSFDCFVVLLPLCAISARPSARMGRLTAAFFCGGAPVSSPEEALRALSGISSSATEPVSKAALILAWSAGSRSSKLPYVRLGRSSNADYLRLTRRIQQPRRRPS